MNICTNIHKMDSGIFDARIFDVLVPYIRVFKAEGNYLEIEIPHGLAIDIDEARKYFLDDTTLNYERGKRTVLTGSLKDPAIFSYCMAKYYEVGPKF